MNKDTQAFNNRQLPGDKKICDLLAKVIDKHLQEAENKIWHAHPVWFIEGNPVVGYSRLKKGLRLMFWSGASFDEPDLIPGTGKFKDASVIYNSVEEINQTDLKRWLKKAKEIQWNYKNLIKRKGGFERIS
ncbi:MAG TPA: DUF1801 domain-containing protein [Chitinophagaceae bacterium]